jgi:hypothetical protein
LSLGCWAGRLVLQADGWEVIIDKRRCFSDLLKGLADGGYALTHTGMLRRIDGASFDQTAADQVLTALFYFLSFAGGLWSGPALPVGYAGTKRVWEQWIVHNTTSWRTVRSWFPTHTPVGNELDQGFKGFLQRWNDNLWQDPTRFAVHWYVSSNLCAGGIEGGIILTQTALEMLASVVLVEDPCSKQMKHDAYHKMPAHEKIRSLLSSLGIPGGIPAELCDLTSAATALRVSDGPGIISTIRNKIAHAEERNRAALSRVQTEAKGQAWVLGLWYLEMVLLRLWNYSGNYDCRFRSGYPDDRLAQVPWVSPTVRTP